MKHARSDYDRIQDPANIIPEDEPVFLLRGKDQFAPQTVEAWAKAVEDAGGDKRIIEAAFGQVKAMYDWQEKHGCKMPDMPVSLTEVTEAFESSEDEIRMTGARFIRRRIEESKKEKEFLMECFRPLFVGTKEDFDSAMNSLEKSTALILQDLVTKQLLRQEDASDALKEFMEDIRAKMVILS